MDTNELQQEFLKVKDEFSKIKKFSDSQTDNETLQSLVNNCQFVLDYTLAQSTLQLHSLG